MTTAGRTTDGVVSSVVQRFGDFSDEVPADRVEHVTDALMPRLDAIAGARELRPGLTAACTGSAAPYHFLDLQGVWLGNELDDTHQLTPVHPSGGGARSATRSGRSCRISASELRMTARDRLALHDSLTAARA